MVSWEADILEALQERDAHEKSLAPMIENHRRLSLQMITLRDRNRTLLKAATSARSAGTGHTGEDNPVRAAYVASLEGQIASLRDELAALYKTQSQNAQRLLVLNEQLQESESRSREEGEQLRSSQAEVDKLMRRSEEARTTRKEKEKAIEHLQDELSTLQLEYSQLEKRNADLKDDNKSLLQRWLDMKNDEISQVNEVNAFIEQAGRLKGHSPPIEGKRSSPSPARSGASPAREKA